MAEAPAPEFVLFVSSVAGHAVAVFGAPARKYFGAKLSTAEEVAAGSDRLVWNTERVIAIDDNYARRYARELEQALANGELKRRSREDFDAYQAARAERRAARKAEREAAAEKPPEAPPSSEADAPKKPAKPTKNAPEQGGSNQ